MTAASRGAQLRRAPAPSWTIGWLLAVAGVLSAAGTAAMSPGDEGEKASGGEEVILGAPAAIDPAGTAGERIEVAAGTPVRERPDRVSGALAIVDSAQELPVLERRGVWTRVRYGGLNGWIRTVGEDGESGEDGSGLPVGSRARGRTPEPGVLQRALSLLDQPVQRPLGPWTLYTDLRDRRLLGTLDRVATEAVRAYRELYGLEPGLDAEEGAGGEEVVVVFARREDHGAFLGEGARFGANEIGGSAGFGLAVLHREDRTDAELRVLLAHELVHLLTRRTLGLRTPPWLEEGLADGLAFSRIDASGGIHPDELGGTFTSRGEWFRPPHLPPRVVTASSGPRAAVERLVALLDRRTLPGLRTLLSMDWSTLVDPRRRHVTYAHSSMFVRFLLDGDAGRWRKGFRSYLQVVAAGGETAVRQEALVEALGTDWETLEKAFRRWIRAQAVVNRTF